MSNINTAKVLYYNNGTRKVPKLFLSGIIGKPFIYDQGSLYDLKGKLLLRFASKKEIVGGFLYEDVTNPICCFENGFTVLQDRIKKDIKSKTLIHRYERLSVYDYDGNMVFSKEIKRTKDGTLEELFGVKVDDEFVNQKVEAHKKFSDDEGKKSV